MSGVRRLRRVVGRGAGALAFARAAPFYARYTIRFHLPAELLIGLYSGVFMLAACGLLTVHAGLLCLTTSFAWLVAAYVVFGVAMTAVNLAWNLGPMQFAPDERASTDYMAVHVTLTGLRGMIGPLLAVGTKRLFGLRAGFALSGLLFLAAALLMLRLSRRLRREATAS